MVLAGARLRPTAAVGAALAAAHACQADHAAAHPTRLADGAPQLAKGPSVAAP